MQPCQSGWLEKTGLQCKCFRGSQIHLQEQISAGLLIYGQATCYGLSKNIANKGAREREEGQSLNYCPDVSTDFTPNAHGWGLITSVIVPVRLHQWPSPTCYSCSSCPDLPAKRRIVSVLVLDVLQRFAFSVRYECVHRQKERERRQVVVTQKGSQYFD